MATKTFPLRDVLSVVTTRLLSKPEPNDPSGMDAIYNILGHMTKETPNTPQIERFMDECRPWLYRWFPELGIAEAALPKLDEYFEKAGEDRHPAVELWIEELKMLDGRIELEYEIPQIPDDDHDRIDPYDEIVQARGTDEGIEIVQSSDESPGTNDYRNSWKELCDER